MTDKLLSTIIIVWTLLAAVSTPVLFLVTFFEGPQLWHIVNIVGTLVTVGLGVIVFRKNKHADPADDTTTKKYLRWTILLSALFVFHFILFNSKYGFPAWTYENLVILKPKNYNYH